jgi:general secretion pathway protein C
VLIANGGRTEVLAFPDPAQLPAEAGQAAAPPVAKAAPVGPPPPPNNAAALIARLGATPSGNGYRIGDGAPAGLQPGDVVQSINGAPLTDAQSAQAAFAAAAQGGSAQITIVRDGRPITLTVPTR